MAGRDCIVFDQWCSTVWFWGLKDWHWTILWAKFDWGTSAAVCTRAGHQGPSTALLPSMNWGWVLGAQSYCLSSPMHQDWLRGGLALPPIQGPAPSPSSPTGNLAVGERCCFSPTTKFPNPLGALWPGDNGIVSRRLNTPALDLLKRKMVYYYSYPESTLIVC